MDETAVYYDMPYRYTIAETGSSSIKLQTHCQEKKRVTVVLTCDNEGGKLPPLVLTDRKTLRRITVPDGLFVATKVPHSFMNQQVMVKWLDLNRQILQQPRQVLLLDSFAVHKTQLVRDHALNCGIVLDFIPPSMTSTLQPLDVGLMKPFKDGLRKRWTAFTRPLESVKPGLQHLLVWIKESWDEIRREVVVAAFERSFN
jgi:hypothetical protein